MNKEPRILLLDIETLPLVTATFSLYPDSISHENIISDQSIICICWKFLGEKRIYSSTILDDPKAFNEDITNDLVVVSKIREVLEDVDIVIGHNVKKFDYRKVQARIIYHALEPLPSGIQLLDTLTEARKIAAFTSNRLDYLGKHLSDGGKTETSKGLWFRVLRGDEKAVEEMTAYCKNDVQILEDVYLRLLPYMKSHPNLASPETHNCPKCNSSDIVKDGVRMRSSGARYQTYRCKGCGASFSDTKTIVKPESKV